MTDARPIRYKVEYAKTNRSSCSFCKKTLQQAKMRIGRLSPSPFHDGYITTWFHVQCFWTKYPLEQQNPKKKPVATARSVKEIEGFDKLRMEDQNALRKILNEKEEENDEGGLDNEEKAKMEAQNKMEWDLKDKLRLNCQLKDLKRLITYNNLEVSGGQDTLIDQIAEGILYGIPICPQCRTRGEMYFKDGLYRCRKELDWGKCGYKGGVSSIQFEDWRIDPDIGINFLIQWNQPRRERFVSLKQLSNRQNQKIETYKRNPNSPLQSMKFAIAGETERPYDHLKTIIIEHGGSFYDIITHDIDYVITSFEDLLNANKEIERRKKNKLMVSKEEEERKRKEEEERKRKEEEERERRIEEEKRRKENEIITDRIPDDGSVMSGDNKEEDDEEERKRKEEEEERMMMIKKKEEEEKEELNKKAGFIEKIIQSKELGLAMVTELIVDRLIKEFGFDQRPYLLEGKLPPIAFAKLDESTDDGQNQSTSKYIKDQFNFGEVDPKSKVSNGKVYRERRITEDGKEITEVYDLFLTQSDYTKGSNKFYRMQIIDMNGNNKSFALFLKWGRIGAFSGQQKLTSPSSLSNVMSLWKEKYLEKTDNKWDDRDTPFIKKPGFYFPLKFEEKEKNESDNNGLFDKSSFVTIPSLLDLRLQSLVSLIFNEDMMKRNMIELDIDITRLPIHNISKNLLTKAYEILKEIENLLNDDNNNNDDDNNNKMSKNLQISSLSNQFYTLIPHDFGMKMPELIDNKNRLKSKMKQLDILTNIEIASSFMKEESSYVNMNPIDINYKKLGCLITPLSQYSSEFSLISKCVQNGYDKEKIKSNINVLDVYKVERSDEIERFNQFKNIKNRMLLWHGSRLCNFVGILSNGLRIAPPEAPSSGYMFGKGLYFADLLQKSVSYTHPDPNDKIALVLLCEVALGNMYEVNKPQYITSLPDGKNSTKAVSKLKPSRFQKLSNGCLIPNGKPINDDDNYNDSFLDEAEYIVYNESQVKIMYIVKIKIDDI